MDISVVVSLWCSVSGGSMAEEWGTDGQNLTNRLSKKRRYQLGGVYLLIRSDGICIR